MSTFNRFVKINPMYVLPMKQHINQDPSSGYHDASLPPPLLDAVDFHLPRLFAISSCS
jgi:hypothetical protein